MRRLKLAAIVTCLALACGSLEAQRLPSDDTSATYSSNANANALFLKARALAKAGDPRFGGKLSNSREAISVYEQAVKADPRLALAYVEMARTWMTLGYSDPDALPDSVTMPPVHEDLRKALEIDPGLADAHLLSATIAYNYDFDWLRAEQEYQKAILLMPANARAHTSYGAYLTSMGRFAEALTELGKADAIEPSSSNDFSTARAYYSMRDFGKAEGECLRSLKKQDNVLCHAYLGFVYLAQGDQKHALEEMEVAQHFSKNAGAAAILAYGYAMSGERAKAEDLLKRLFLRNEFGPPPAYRIAAIYLALGNRDEALRWLEKSYEQHENWINQAKVDPVMDPLRSDPRFERFMQKLHFA